MVFCADEGVAFLANGGGDEKATVAAHFGLPINMNAHQGVIAVGSFGCAVKALETAVTGCVQIVIVGGKTKLS